MSNEQMTFPNTWEEFEKRYGFKDAEEIYTNGARLIPSFRVEQWLDHLQATPIIRCKDCARNDNCFMYRESGNDYGFCAWSDGKKNETN